MTVAIAVLLPGCVGSFGTGGGNAAPSAPPLQVALAAEPPRVLLGGAVAFRADVPGDLHGLAYEWDFGNGQEARGTDLAALRHTFSEPGSFEVRVTVTDGLGHTAVDTVTVAIDQRAEVSGSLATIPGLKEAEPFTSTVTFAEGLHGLAVDLHLNRTTGALAVPGEMRATVRLLGPSGKALLEREVDVPEGGARLAADLAAGQMEGPGEYTLEIRVTEGAVSFSGHLLLTYMSG